MPESFICFAFMQRNLLQVAEKQEVKSKRAQGNFEQELLKIRGESSLVIESQVLTELQREVNEKVLGVS